MPVVASACEGARRRVTRVRSVPLEGHMSPIDDRLGQEGERPIGFDNGEVSAVDGGDLVNAESFGAGDHRCVHGAQGQAAVLVDQVRDP